MALVRLLVICGVTVASCPVRLTAASYSDLPVLPTPYCYSPLLVKGPPSVLLARHIQGAAPIFSDL